jgi:hypothetical protein
MQVRGLPRQIIRNASAASRLLAAKTLNIEAERRRDAVRRWRGDGQRPDRRAGAASGGRAAFDALPMGEVPRAALAPSQSRPAAQMAAGFDRSRRSRPRRQSDVGQAQDRRAAQA